MEKLDAYAEGKNKKRRMNKAQRIKEIDATDISMGCILYTHLGNPHKEAVILEILARGGTVRPQLGIKKLVATLHTLCLEKDGEKYNKAFHLMTDNLHSKFPYLEKSSGSNLE